MASSSWDPNDNHGTSSAVGVGGDSVEAVVMASEQVFPYKEGGVTKKAKKERGCTAKERISKMTPCTAGKRSSIYRGVTRHRWTGRYEAHLWDKSTWNQNQNKKGKQVYLGAYDDEEAAARAYDLAALKYWGPGTLINFPVGDYKRDLDEMTSVSREEYLGSLRRKSSGFSRGLSRYRGLSSPWDPAIGCLSSSEYLTYMGYGDNPVAERDFSVERRIDLTGYIKWWGSNKGRQPESMPKTSGEEKPKSFVDCFDEDIGGELRTSEWMAKPTKPYEMPRLGMPIDGRRQTSSALSALAILSQSEAYKKLQQRASNWQDKGTDDENENKNVVSKMDYGKASGKLTSFDQSDNKLNGAFALGGLLPLQKNWYPLAPFLSAPQPSSCSSDNLVDPMIWPPLAPASPNGSSHNLDATKTESTSSYKFFQHGE